MNAIMDTLRREHRSAEKLLDILDGQCSVIGRGDEPDYTVLEEIVDYFLDYPDLFHHPKEDALLGVLRERSAVTAGEVGDLHAQHLELARLTRQLADAVQQLETGAVVPRAELVSQMRDFITFSRQHISWEETVFFPAAERTLQAADWRQLEQKISKVEDPLARSGGGRDKYRAIRDDILRASGSS